MLKLKFEIEETEIGHFTCLEEHIKPCYDLGESDLFVVGNFIHHALVAAGYPMEGDTVLLQGLTYEEAEMLEDYLEDIRTNRKGDE